MGDFERRDDRANWLTIKQAAAYLGIEPGKEQSVRNAVRTRAEFRGDSNVLLVGVEGYEIPPFTYINKAALDAYKANGKASTGSRVPKGGAKRWIIRLTPEQERAFRAGEINTSTLVLEVASTPKKKAAPATDNGTPPAEGASVQMTIGDIPGAIEPGAIDTSTSHDDQPHEPAIA
jgi:hypothetical protein